MKGLEKLAIALAIIGLIISIIFKVADARYLVTATGVWRFTMVCLGFAVWARLRLMGPCEGERAPGQAK